MPKRSQIRPHTTVRVKEPDLDQYLVVDRYRRTSLVDHFLSPGLPMANFVQMRYEEQGDFVDQRYETKTEQDEKGLSVIMTCDGQMQRAGALRPVPVHLTKTLFLPLGEEKLVIRYIIENKSRARLQTFFACEWNVNLLGGGGNPQADYRIAGQQLENSHFDSTGEVTNVDEFSIGNTWLRQEIDFTLSEPATLWRFSIETLPVQKVVLNVHTREAALFCCGHCFWKAGQSWSVEIIAYGRLPIPVI